jgi:hypothetical protein
MEKLNEHHQDLRNRPPSPPNLGELDLSLFCQSRKITLKAKA